MERPSSGSSSWKVFSEALKALRADHHAVYNFELGSFFDFIGIANEEKDSEKRASVFVERARNDTKWAFNQIISYIVTINDKQAARNALSTLRLFCEFHDISLRWELISIVLLRGERVQEPFDDDQKVWILNRIEHFLKGHGDSIRSEKESILKKLNNRLLYFQNWRNKTVAITTFIITLSFGLRNLPNLSFLLAPYLLWLVIATLVGAVTGYIIFEFMKSRISMMILNIETAFDLAQSDLGILESFIGTKVMNFKMVTLEEITGFLPFCRLISLYREHLCIAFKQASLSKLFPKRDREELDSFAKREDGNIIEAQKLYKLLFSGNEFLTRIFFNVSDIPNIDSLNEEENILDGKVGHFQREMSESESFAGLLHEYIYQNEFDFKREFDIKPKKLIKNLRSFTSDKRDEFPLNMQDKDDIAWLWRKLNDIKSNPSMSSISKLEINQLNGRINIKKARATVVY